MLYSYINGDPIVAVDVKSKDGSWYVVPAYLDSGAGYSVFTKDYAFAFGLNLKAGRKINLTVGNGEKIDAYVHKLSVKFASKEFIAEISFSPNLGVGTNILGMKSFFDNFHICFNNKKSQVEINSFYLFRNRSEFDKTF